MSFLSKMFLVITIYTAIFGLSQARTFKWGCIEDQKVYVKSIHSAIKELSRASKAFSPDGVLERLGKDEPTVLSLENCRTYISLALDNLKNSLISPSESLLDSVLLDDIKTWVGGAGADINTCIEEFAGDKIRNLAQKKLRKTFELIKKSFDLTERFDSCISSSYKIEMRRKGNHNHRHKHHHRHRHNHNHNCRHQHKHDNKHKHLSPKVKSIYMKPNFLVAQDGSGNYTTISDALNAVRDCSLKRTVIHVKKGVYFENVKVAISKWNVTMIGDGINQTVVSGHLNTRDGRYLSLTATFAVYGNRFIARGMTFRNTADAIRGQAIALHSSSDRSIFYQCSIEGYQDSLSVQSTRQFFRECYIYGTVDFIFGSSSIVIQSSFILLRKPIPGQENVILSHEKRFPTENTGITLHNCTIRPAEDITGIRTFLGRPRSNFSVMAYLENQIDIKIDPKGWLTVDGPNALPPPPETVVNVEYNNNGIGADTRGRVKWPGVKIDPSYIEASKYTVGFLSGETQWILVSGVPFDSGL